MIIEHIELINFRNYIHLDLKPEPFLNLLIGENAQGKTNILESIHLVCKGQSHRFGKEEEFINWDKNYFVIKISLLRKDRSFKLEMLYQKNNPKQIKINGQSKIKMNDLIGKLNLVMFSPEDLNIVKSSPNLRRSFLDSELSQINKIYYQTLNKYNRVLSQRNNLLKNIKDRKAQQELLYGFDEQLWELAEKIIYKRLEIVSKLNLLARLIHRKITDGIENLEIKYVNSLKTDDYSNLREEFRKQSLAIREQEIIRGTTLIGPHRDDLIFLVNNVNIRIYGSQGQQRTTVLALKLAELELFKVETGEYPILFLDDVMSELDDKRRFYLINTIKDKIQTFITSTNKTFYEKLETKNKSIWLIKNGTVQRG